MKDIERLVREFRRENGADVSLSYDMPAGYEAAYGTYDVTVNTLFLNEALLRDAPEYEAFFYLFHELRHAEQHLFPSRFDRRIRESMSYVILYNGCCYRLIENGWRECSLKGDGDYFTCAYMSLPYELDANNFAYEKTKEICGDTEELRELYSFWLPNDGFDYEEHRRLFRRIDEELGISEE